MNEQRDSFFLEDPRLNISNMETQQKSTDNVDPQILLDDMMIQEEPNYELVTNLDSYNLYLQAQKSLQDSEPFDEDPTREHIDPQILLEEMIQEEPYEFIHDSSSYNLYLEALDELEKEAYFAEYLNQ